MGTEPISHPATDGDEATRLLDHLDDVAGRAESVVSADATTIGGDPLPEMTAVVARCHDFGKATTWFQAYVVGERDASDRTNHSLLGAYLGYYVLDRLGYDSEDCLAALVALAKHHGQLPDVEEYVDGVSRFENTSEASNERQRILIEQVGNVDDHRRQFAQSFVADATDGNGSWEEFAQSIEDESLFDTVHEHVSLFGFGSDRSAPSEEFYGLLLQLWSGLVFADKTVAAGIENGDLDGSEPDARLLSEYIADLGGDTDEDGQAAALDTLRGEARDDVLGGVERFRDSEVSIATLTLPTGMGKTLTGLSAALALRDEGERVVYALPFTSVIDQVADELADVFDTDARDDLLTIHHHLAETVTKLGDPDEDPDEYARLAEMVAESWRSGMTLTTFVQLFESLVGPSNTQSMKLPALYDSVIVLDEPQALPMQWWKLVRRIATILTEEYDATIVAMTATQPRATDEETASQALFDDAFELVDDVDRYFGHFERVEYDVHDSVLAFDDTDAIVDYETAGRTILDETGRSESTLAICNTIDSATALTDAIEEREAVVDVGRCLELELDDGADVDALVERVESTLSSNERALVHLSTRLRPRDRLALVEATKRLTERDVPVLAVSTQLIEAGVDISFDRVYRDIAPIDSVVQAAGRCNRSFESDLGTVTVWWLAPPAGTTTTPAQAVYDSEGVSTISLTARTLDAIGADDGTVAEQTMTRDAVEHYYGLVADRNPGDPEYVKWVDEANADALGGLSLIGQRESVDVVVCRTDGDRELADAMVAALDEFDYDAFGDYREAAKDITVSLPIYSRDSTEAETVRNLEPLGDADLRVLRRARGTSYFDETKGLAVDEPCVDDRFL
ncbi:MULTISPECIES: CRISPR-associated endonuclease Cas3'' [Halomicrobium]|uniref:CRISPR-associated endonuclease Cas3 n=2 Tax=Halomicrobium mukohataei TaxID=57705 RepID=A0A4D6KB29_9EURY|nr:MULTISPECIES: CRISPR-associated endonuclease Cas3'' [Halomicrobium]ACV48941.1 putative helicase [Halomicrobium mukohataei DSM 12286]QCD64365.1 CRISPR-associated endonuclease Cas3'' [Halomicrobium mukohataei]QFR19171.1 CRISPR-associated endonuclease Cas3'' [Halomicrobium sp. ZPS1]